MPSSKIVVKTTRIWFHKVISLRLWEEIHQEMNLFRLSGFVCTCRYVALPCFQMALCVLRHKGENTRTWRQNGFWTRQPGDVRLVWCLDQLHERSGWSRCFKASQPILASQHAHCGQGLRNGGFCKSVGLGRPRSYWNVPPGFVDLSRR